MDSPASAPPGLLGSLRGFADGLLGSAHDRIELLAIELEEEKHRIAQILLWAGGIAVLALLALVFVSFAIVVALWETARVAAVCALAGVYVAGLVAAVVAFRRFLRRQPRPFGGTLEELRTDRACIRDDN